MRLVLDTNVLVSGLLSRDASPGALLQAWFDDEYDVVTSAEQYDELRRTLKYPRVAERLPPGAGDALEMQIQGAAIFASELPIIDLSIDSDDNAILATAVAGRADYLVSGDTKHVLPLGQVNGIPIISPADALTVLRRRRPLR